MNRDVPPGKHTISLWETIQRIQSLLTLSDADMAGLMELTEKEYWKLRGSWGAVSMLSCMRLSRNLGFSVEALLTGEIDYPALLKAFQGDSDTLPERYLVAAFSKRRTLKYILKFLRDQFGYSFTAMLLRRFQVNEAALLAENKPINLRLATDLSTFLLDNMQQPEIVREIGRRSYLGLKDCEFGKASVQARNLKELYEIVLGHDGLISKYLEKNFVYKIASIKSEEYKIIAQPLHDAIAEVGREHAFAESGCLIREGFMSGIPQYLGLMPVRSRIDRCVSRGDPYMVIHLDFNGRSKLRPDFLRSLQQS